MKRLISVAFLALILTHPTLVSGSHPFPTERSWTVAFQDRLHSTNANERKGLKQLIRTELRQFKKAKRSGEDPDIGKLLLTLIALILPPLAVYLHQGEINSKFWISLLLTLLIWVPGVVYALLVIFGVIP
jgi:uncharacterized membrane protein YqaE (UPF0057 family)